jgi:large subunit ribosomal protein L30
MAKYYKVKLKRGRIGTTQNQRAALDCLKLKKINDTVVVKDDPAMRGQIFRLQHLLEISEAQQPKSTERKK